MISPIRLRLGFISEYTKIGKLLLFLLQRDNWICLALKVQESRRNISEKWKYKKTKTKKKENLKIKQVALF